MIANFKVTNERACKVDQSCIVFNWHTLNEVDQHWGSAEWAERTAIKYPDHVVAIFKVKKIKNS